MSPPSNNRAGFEGFSREHIALGAFILAISFQVEPGDGDWATETLEVDPLSRFVQLKEVPSIAEFAVIAHPRNAMNTGDHLLTVAPGDTIETVITMTAEVG
jgi:hypothetical protein